MMQFKFKLSAHWPQLSSLVPENNCEKHATDCTSWEQNQRVAPAFKFQKNTNIRKAKLKTENKAVIQLYLRNGSVRD